MADEMVRLWIEFDIPPPAPQPEGPGVTLDGGDSFAPTAALRQGVGVTGYDLRDCLGFVQRQMLEGAALPPVTRVVENVDVSALAVSDRVGVPAMRGIWFPRLHGRVVPE